ncbi:ABC transporter substrate-binding protein [Phytoactinopolyspora halotolerans]|uniref:ABC transporter substrate-binding protein n=1 Tax=Phytoactinopolyspora halotolerans TaxID=1981512 RepID=UPI001C205301|nr:extracellular solute-binding protein [Phytoactinopolyspora halotolerans]
MKRHHLIRSLAIATLTAGALVLASCSSDSGGSDGDVVLELVQSGDVNQGGAFAKLSDKYFDETGVRVEVVEVPNDDLRTRLRTAAQADDLPALAASPSTDPAWTERLLDLTDIFNDVGVIDTLAVADPADDKVKAMPTTLTAVGMFLNKSLWDEAGVEYPTTLDEQWTWDEYVDKANEVVAATDAEYGVVMDASAHRLRSFLFEFGSDGVTEQSDGSWALDEAGAEALEYFKQLHDDGVMPQAVWGAADDPSATFKSGRVAGYMSGVWQIADFQETITDFEWVSVPLPQQPVRATNYGAASWIVAFDGTGVEEETLDFIEWMYSEENYRLYCETQGCLPALDGLEVSYEQDEYAFQLYNGEIAASPAISAVQTTDGLRFGYEGKAIDSEPLKDETTKYLNNEQSLEETVENINNVSTEQMAD